MLHRNFILNKPPRPFPGPGWLVHKQFGCGSIPRGHIPRGHIHILSIVVFSCQAPCQASFRPLPLGVKLGRQLVVGKINQQNFASQAIRLFGRQTVVCHRCPKQMRTCRIHLGQSWTWTFPPCEVFTMRPFHGARLMQQVACL